MDGFAGKNDIYEELPTVAAISTPYGRGGVAMLRVSGGNARQISERVFLPRSGKTVGELPHGSAVFGDILADGEKIDEGVLIVYRAPRSFTGEDVCELCCHGGTLLSAKVLEALLRAGARSAGPGEFTKRAFLNGKLSLEKAESIADLIDAENDHQLRLASKNAGGALEKRICAIARDLTELLADAYVTIDYPDEDLNELSGDEFKEKLTRARLETARLLDSYKTGHAVARGVKTAIVGRPNTGKSSLLNLLLGRERAIVSDIPGTTRDTVEESARIGMITLRLIDTAGLRRSDDPIERMGVQRSCAAMEEAELIFAVFDRGETAGEEDLALIKELKSLGKPVIAFMNKADRQPAFDPGLLDGFETVVCCTKSGQTPPELEAILNRLYDACDIAALDEGLLTSARQRACAARALSLLDGALAALDAGECPNVVSIDVEAALGELRGLTGQEVGEEIVSSIFSRFCVGK